MIIDDYYDKTNGRISFTREQGSEFAKNMANDFNPIHDVDAKRFCIPGDLLFAVILARYGVSQHMEFIFSGMVVEGVELIPPEPSPGMRLLDEGGREYLQVNISGESRQDDALVKSITQSYVEFSGRTFPRLLVPLLADQGVMINPDRPIVMYQSMVIDLDTLDISGALLESDGHRVEINGKRGSVDLAFHLVSNGEIVGRGKKCMLLSGLKPYDKQLNAEAINRYEERVRTLSV